MRDHQTQSSEEASKTVSFLKSATNNEKFNSGDSRDVFTWLWERRKNHTKQLLLSAILGKYLSMYKFWFYAKQSNISESLWIDQDQILYIIEPTNVSA